MKTKDQKQVRPIIDDLESHEASTQIGSEIAELLGLKKNKDGNYKTQYGTKSPRGLARMLARCYGIPA